MNNDPSTAMLALEVLEVVSNTLKERDAIYKGSDILYSKVMEAMFPEGVSLRSAEDHHRFHLFMLKMVKVSRYARNWQEGHADSLLDDAAYSAMLAAIDRTKKGTG